MSVNGLEFILFLIISVFGYYIIPQKLRWIVLLISGAVFYVSFKAVAAVYLVATILVTYLFALRLDKLAAYRPDGFDKAERAAQKKANTHKLRTTLTVALLLDFSSLIILKYTGFLAETANSVFHTKLPIPAFILPLGLSFYVFQTAGYLMDVYRGKYRAQRNIFKYALFVSYFPQMIQGPINRYNTMSDQLYNGNKFDWLNIQTGFYRIILGLLKKALIADPLHPIVTEIYSNYGSYPGTVSFIGAALYCLQLYCDFSGGIDVVCGASQLFGVKMAENFKQPYFATSLADFWRRWHISLGDWMADYLFYPLALSKKLTRVGKLARKILPPDIAKRVVPCIATFIVFLAVGMWQGPGMANIAYGLWNGLWMSLGLIWVPFGSKLDSLISYKKHKKLTMICGIISTNLLVIIGRYFSNAATLTDAIGMLKHTFVSPEISELSSELFTTLGFSLPLVIKLFLSLTILFIISLAKEKDVNLTVWLGSRKWYTQFAVLFIGLLLVVFSIYANDSYVPISFVYENV